MAATNAAIAPDEPVMLYVLDGGPAQFVPYMFEPAMVALAIIAFIYAPCEKYDDY
jgi:hypothetical protein